VERACARGSGVDVFAHYAKSSQGAERIIGEGVVGADVGRSRRSLVDLLAIVHRGRCHDRARHPPHVAIGTAKDLVETTCKTILHARGVAFDESTDIVEL
jgi:hypothetical protein